MIEFDNRRIVELILYVLNKGQLLTQYQLYKILYFAERKHLLKWGAPILPVEFRAWECGPVPKKIYDSLKHLGDGKYPLDEMIYEAVERGDKDANDYLFPKREADMDYISLSEKEALDSSYEENIRLNFGQLMNKSHDLAWQKARAGGMNVPMYTEDIAIAAGAHEDMVEYIRQQESIKDALEG